MINFLPTNVVCWLILQNLEGAMDPHLYQMAPC